MKTVTSKRGVVEVVHEEIDQTVLRQPQSVDVLLREWMWYWLLYKSMAKSFMEGTGGFSLEFVAGFGKGGISLPFWENMYDFSLSCVGKELVKDASQIPVVDVVDHQDLTSSFATLLCIRGCFRRHDIRNNS